MAVAQSALLTWEKYLTEGEVNRRYDILDGVRVMANPTEEHQDIVFNLAAAFKQYGQVSGRGKMIIAPQDVLITRVPLRTRQPDVLFISNERRARNRPPHDPSPLDPAPELVVEILSPSDTQRALEDKIADYCAVGVLEAWIVHQDAQTVEVIRLSSQGAETVAVYGMGESAQSVVFPDLVVAVADLFAK